MQAEAVQESKTLISPDLEHLELLIVDDEPVVCEALQGYLKHHGIINIQTAHDGPAALEAADRTRYDYVFVDLMMPGMNGMEVLKKIRNVSSSTLGYVTLY